MGLESWGSVKDVRMGEQEASQRKEKRMQELRNELQKPKKKKFMTPERKKKLRQLLMREAAKQLKIEQEKKEAERRKVIRERTGEGKNLEGATDQQLREICNAYHKRIVALESEKFDLERDVQVKDVNINELNIAVNDLKGKYVKPTLKKVSKYENKFAKLQKKAAEFNFRNQLKTVKKKEFAMKEEEEKTKKKPNWALQNSLSTVSLGKLGEDGAEEGLDVEEEE